MTFWFLEIFLGIFSAEVTFTCGGPQVYYSITPKMYYVLYDYMKSPQQMTMILLVVMTVPRPSERG